MYRPSYTVNGRQDLAIELMQEYPLGLLISQQNGKLETSYLPFIFEHHNNEFFLLSHCAKANPISRLLNAEAIVSFQGPSSYISPTIYVDKVNVPTWNYAVVQVHGTIEIISDKDSLKKILNKTVSVFESKNNTNWSYQLPESVQEKLEMAIVGLRMRVTAIEAKFKLSQNRNSEDDNAVLDFFKNSKSSKDQELYQWMRKTRA